jgi:hypothetical protein
MHKRPAVRRSLQLSPIAHLPSIFPSGRIVAFNAGPEGNIYLVAALSELDYRAEEPGWAIFPKTIPDQAQRYRVVVLSGGKPVLDLLIEGERFNIHGVQPLGDEILLICARSHYRGPDDYDKNGRIYTRDGEFVRGILLGDGIHSVQATSGKVVWTSYMDEGIFGNLGWEDPVGSSGLVAWSQDGEKLYEHRPAKALDAIIDCYALNVSGNEDVWFYHDSEFTLVHLHLQKLENQWAIPVPESDGFAVSGSQALFRGGHEERDTYHLFSLRKKGRFRKVSEIELRDREGNKLIADQIVSRGDTLFLLSGDFLYCLDMNSALGV